MSEDVYGPLGNMGLQYTAKTIYDPDKGKAINFNEEPYAPAFYDMPNHLTLGGIRFKNDKGNGSYFIGAFGYRSDDLGKIEQYGNYGGALTSNPICIQWPDDNEASDLQQFFLIGSSRMYFELSKAYSPISSSSFAHAFPVIPAKTGSNPAK